WGTKGIAWGWVAAYPLVALPLYWKTFNTIAMPVRDYLKALRPALNGTLIMVLAVSLLKWSAPPGWPLWLRLLLEITTGAMAYGSALLLLHRERMVTFAGVIR